MILGVGVITVVAGAFAAIGTGQNGTVGTIMGGMLRVVVVVLIMYDVVVVVLPI